MNDNLVTWSQNDMLEISLNSPDDFLKVKETLTRIGIASTKDSNILYQSCHILHKHGRYYIMHFKEMFLLDGRESTFTEEDLSRRNTIALLLSDWGLLSIVDYSKIGVRSSLKKIKIVQYRDKQNWTLTPKYNIGRK